MEHSAISLTCIVEPSEAPRFLMFPVQLFRAGKSAEQPLFCRAHKKGLPLVDRLRLPKAIRPALVLCVIVSIVQFAWALPFK